MNRQILQIRKIICLNSSALFLTFLSIFLLLPVSSVAVCQKPSPSPTPTPERSRQIVALLNDARLAAPELAVDTFLKVVESKKVTDPVWRKEIIDEALRMIDDVQYPTPMRPAYGGKVERDNELLDTEDFVLVVAYGAKLDRLSFKGRVITLLLETEPARAKQMIFQMGGQLGLKPRSCEDALTYSPDGIFTVVGKVAKAVFTEQQIAEGQRALFVAPWIENIESPRQIYPALDLVQQLQGSAAERQILFDAASRAIDRNFKDDRSFTYAWEAITARTAKLVADEADPLKSELNNAFRGMLLKNLRGTRCKDNEIKKDEPLPDYIEAANKLFPEKPLTFEDVSTSEFGGTAKLTHILKKSSAARKFREEGMAVRDTPIIDNKAVKHDVTDVAWVSRVTEYIDRVLSFEGSDNETEAEMLFIKGGFVGGIMSGISPGELRKSVVRKYLRLLAGSRLQKTSFIEWRFWITDAERMAPESFYDIASEFPNTNLKVMAAASKLLEEPKKESPKPTPTPTPEPERPREIVALLNDARLAAPELGVDTFLKLVESKKITDPVWRKEILEEALRMTDDVKHPVRRERGYFETRIVDTVSGYMTYSYDLGLDTLSLKARIIKAWLLEDKMRARQIVFQVGGDLTLKPLRCEDSIGYVVGDIYVSVGAVSKGAFTPTEIGDGVRGLFLLPWVENIQSPSQILPLIDLLSGLQSPPAERQLLINAFERAISRSFGDDRSFSHAFSRGAYEAASFIREAEERAALSSAWRELLVKNSGGPRCLDSKPAKGELPSPISYFNPMFQEEKRFSAEDFASVEYRGVPKDKLYLDSEGYKKISLLFKTARETRNRTENKDDKSAQLDWQIKITEVLEALDSWNASIEEPESEVFNMKTVFYRTMIPEVADPEMKIVVMRAFMRYLAGSPMQKDSFIEWLYHVRWMAKTEPDLFMKFADELPNPNFKVIVEASKLLEGPKKELPKLTPTPTPTLTPTPKPR